MPYGKYYQNLVIHYGKPLKISSALAVYPYLNESKLFNFRCGKRCYIPRYFMGGNRMEMVLLKDLEDYESLPVTKWNIKQPADEEIREEALNCGGLDVMLIPGMAFTQNGKRLGRGKGYYDTYLLKAKNNMMQPPRTIALAFKEQVVSDVPVDEHDFLIDKVMYE